MKRLLTASGLVAAALAVGLLTPTTAIAAPAAVGSVSVQLTDADGVPVGLAGVEVAALGIRGIDADGLTDAHGRVVLGGITSPQTVTVTTRTIPSQGAATPAPARRTGVAVVTGATTSSTLGLSVGATVRGAIVGPAGALAGKTVTAANQTDTWQVFQTTSDAAGRYEFVGLGSGQYTISAYDSRDAEPAHWKTLVVQQRGAASASEVTLSTHYVHSTYDLEVFANSADRAPDPRLRGATVTVTNTSTGATASSRFSTLLDSEQSAQFVVPTGQYLIELVTTATSTSAAQHLWLARSADGRIAYVTDRASALPVRVAYPYWSGWGGAVPAARA
ncbi:MULTISPECIES: carboxypeptidase-like regulatory domain-containing protein [unclassified Curtobacterium]|uniref:carboxypeptidase-like regulatory domain-containing protein n=1 Tax=unclassified Curtobacterium TaxID=257496 RepID=UPI0037FCF244